MTPRFLLPLLLLADAVFLPAQARAAESYDGCRGYIDSLPASVYQPGIWCLRADLSTSQIDGNAITVTGEGIVLDCNHHKLGGLSAGAATQAYGIRATVSKVTVRNCHIRGFAIGVHGAHVVEGNRFQGITVTAINGGAVIRDNRIVATGGSTIASHATAILAGNALVVDNVIDKVTPRADLSGSGTGYGIYFVADSEQVSGTVANNRVRGVMAAGFGTSTAIMVSGTRRAVVRDNMLWGRNHGEQPRLSNGIVCAIGTKAWLTGNHVLNFSTSLLGCPTSNDVVMN